MPAADSSFRLVCTVSTQRDSADNSERETRLLGALPFHPPAAIKPASKGYFPPRMPALHVYKNKQGDAIFHNFNFRAFENPGGVLAETTCLRLQPPQTRCILLRDSAT
jgi:hypothetical protein